MDNACSYYAQNILCYRNRLIFKSWFESFLKKIVICKIKSFKIFSFFLPSSASKVVSLLKLSKSFSSVLLFRKLSRSGDFFKIVWYSYLWKEHDLTWHISFFNGFCLSKRVFSWRNPIFCRRYLWMIAARHELFDIFLISVGKCTSFFNDSWDCWKYALTSLIVFSDWCRSIKPW